LLHTVAQPGQFNVRLSDADQVFELTCFTEFLDNAVLQLNRPEGLFDLRWRHFLRQFDLDQHASRKIHTVIGPTPPYEHKNGGNNHHAGKPERDVALSDKINIDPWLSR